ncbi:MAG: S1 RNA-binding domain-containing protein, partial [Eubacteriales bacterium]
QKKLEEYEALCPHFTVVDCTCPYVKKIHKIAGENSGEGKVFILIGQKNHPEVRSIISYVNGETEVFSSAAELEKYLKNAKNGEKEINIAAQTTQKLSEWKKCQEIIKKYCTNAKIFDTICSVTEKRQTEAEEICKESDVMIVIGGKESSNTAKLFQVCEKCCPRTYWVQTSKDISPDMIGGAKNIGITAGASTPDGLIQEVKNTMSEIMEENFAELFAKSLEESGGKGKIYTGATVTGTVMSISENEIRLDLGTKVTGVITRDQITEDNDVKLSELFKVGDEVDASVMSVSDKDGIAILSKKKVDGVKNWNKIVEYSKSGETVDGKVSEVTKGGLVVLVDSVKVFIPASMTGTSKNEDLSKFAGQTVQLKIVEIKEDRKRAIGSIRAVIKEQKKEKEELFWSGVEEGKVYEGPVKSITPYGAFVDLGGIDGLVHITELSWKRIKNPAEVVKVGEVIKVFVKSFDKENKRISLGYKTEEENPWNIFKSKYAVGDVADVKIVGITSFGAFAEIVPGVDGLIHISQIADRKIDSVASVLKVGDVCEAKVIEIDDEKKKVSLSIRALLDAEENAEATEPVEATEVTEATEAVEATEEKPEAQE